jgi:hypothetical protein
MTGAMRRPCLTERQAHASRYVRRWVERVWHGQFGRKGLSGCFEGVGGKPTGRQAYAGPLRWVVDQAEEGAGWSGVRVVNPLDWMGFERWN